MFLGDLTKRTHESIRRGTTDWEALVPRLVRDRIKEQQLLGYRPPAVQRTR